MIYVKKIGFHFFFTTYMHAFSQQIKLKISDLESKERM